MSDKILFQILKQEKYDEKGDDDNDMYNNI
jgi:hypothetical protein